MMRAVYCRRDLLRGVGAVGALGSFGLLGACAQQGNGAGSAPWPESVASNPLDTTPRNQAPTFRNFNQLGPTRAIRGGASPLPLPAHGIKLGSARYKYGADTFSIDDYMRRNRTAGILILKGGAVALERYAMGNTPESLWTSFSIAKSVTSTLTGAAVQDGSIASLDDRAGRYVAQLKGSAFADSSIRDLLSMTSGVRWEESYSIFHESDLVRFARAIASGRTGAVMELMRTRPKAAAAGSVFNYSTGDSYVLGAVVAAATRSTLSDYLSQKIWARLGMERDGYWLLDSPAGLETGGDNFSATLRDYARFGQFFVREGVIGSDTVLPPGWRDLAGRPNTAVTGYGRVDPDDPDDPLGFGYQWWAFPKGRAALPFHDGAFTAQGIFGQFLYINPKEDVVAVVWSAWRSAWQDSAERETYSMIGAAVALLQ